MGGKKEENILSVTETAAKLGISRERVLFYIRKNRLAAHRIANTFVVKESDVLKFKRKPVGRPFKNKNE